MYIISSLQLLEPLDLRFSYYFAPGGFGFAGVSGNVAWSAPAPAGHDVDVSLDTPVEAFISPADVLALAPLARAAHAAGCAAARALGPSARATKAACAVAAARVFRGGGGGADDDGEDDALDRLAVTP